MSLTVGSLFAGIGGFELAATWAGITPVWSNEIDPFCCKVLRKNFDHEIIQKDIRKIQKNDLEPIDIICGGDPCQPNSYAGLGKGTADHRFLWPEKFRIIRAIQPSWVVNENVSGSITNGVLDLKIDDLESEGYTCQAYCIPAESVGALHQRERVWLIAHNPNGYAKYGRSGPLSGKEQKIQQREQVSRTWEPVDLWAFASKADRERFQEFHIPQSGLQPQPTRGEFFGFGADPHGNIPRDFIESAIIRMLNGLPEGLDYNQRNKRIKALGNAIVAQVAYEIFKAIVEQKNY